MKHEYDLAELARQAMRERGLDPDYPRDALQQLESIQSPAVAEIAFEDLRALEWVSIDNDDSRDLDQLTYAQKESDGHVALWVAIADVDALVNKDSPIDLHAQVNTTTVYTPAIIFPMLPEKLSTNLTSLNEFEERVAIVVKMVVSPSGEIAHSTIGRAIVRNHAKLTYNGVGSWLEGNGPAPKKIEGTLETALRLQSDTAQLLRKRRFMAGALSLETAEARAVFKDNRVVSMASEKANLAHHIIEECMVGANSTIARYLAEEKSISFRRIVRVPKRWERIVEVAKELGETLPDSPDSKALDTFLVRMRKKDPDAFPDLSLTIVKLLGSGEYIVEKPGENPIGHFGLALRDYTHSTAPNRRYPDIITQRQLKAALQKAKSKYQVAELEILARHCTQQEDAAAKVERQLNKSAAALLLSDSIGQRFKGIVTGASYKGTWVRLFTPAVEGKVIEGMEHLDVGHKVVVKLVRVDVARGYIDFAACQ